MLDHLTLINWTVTPIFLDGGPTSSADGIAATLRPVNTGSAEAVYIESSIFNGRTSGSRAAVLEDWDGVRLVYRYNSGVNNWISSHG